MAAFKGRYSKREKNLLNLRLAALNKVQPKPGKNSAPRLLRNPIKAGRKSLQP